jgi:phenylalanyl-tRNA synthetase beta chain
MKILTEWLRTYLPALAVDDSQLAEDLTLRGIAVEGIFPLNDKSGNSTGSLFDMDITTNRVDAMNHYGIAREVAAIYNLELSPLDTALPARLPSGKPFPVRIDAPDLCGRFTARVIRDVKISPTGGVIARYFNELGQKSISNAVDISNYVLLGMGHPNHVFDLDKIEGGIVVRRAHAGEQIKLLDGATRTLVPDDLVVADEKKALGLAGVMGGYDSMITADTTNILVEAAWFSPVTVRASSRRHLIHTDASHRYERGADFNAPPVASALVTKEILAACGGHLVGELVDVIIPQLESETARRTPIELSIGEVQRILGTTIAPEGITAELVERFLTALGCVLTPFHTSFASRSYAVNLPSWRLDLAREIDLIEEVARVYGYNGFANTLPTPGITIAHPQAAAESRVRARLQALGFSEAISSTFASAEESAFFAPSVPAVPLENPLSEEAANLRPSLVPSMVSMLANNLNRDVLQARLYEVGAIFAGSPAEVHETQSLALGITGAAVAMPPLQSTDDAPFYELKGAIESVLSLFAASAPEFTRNDLPTLYEAGRAAVMLVDSKPIATFGQLSIAEATRRKLRQPVWLAAIDLQTLIDYPLRQPVAQEVSRFQAVERDFSFIFPNSVRWGEIASGIGSLGIANLRSVTPIEIWRNEAKFPGVYSALVRVVFQSNERTLREEDLTSWSAGIIGKLEALDGKIRS